MGFSVEAASRRYWHEEDLRRSESESRRLKAQKFARELALWLGPQDSSLEAIVGFGSTFETWRPFRMDSDIDLGLIGGDWSFLGTLLPVGEFEVSLIDLALQKAEFRAHSLEKGVILYEKHS